MNKERIIYYVFSGMLQIFFFFIVNHLILEEEYKILGLIYVTIMIALMNYIFDKN